MSSPRVGAPWTSTHCVPRRTSSSAWRTALTPWPSVRRCSSPRSSATPCRPPRPARRSGSRTSATASRTRSSTPASSCARPPAPIPRPTSRWKPGRASWVQPSTGRTGDCDRGRCRARHLLRPDRPGPGLRGRAAGGRGSARSAVPRTTSRATRRRGEDAGELSEGVDSPLRDPRRPAPAGRMPGAGVVSRLDSSDRSGDQLPFHPGASSTGGSLERGPPARQGSAS